MVLSSSIVEAFQVLVTEFSPTENNFRIIRHFKLIPERPEKEDVKKYTMVAEN